MAFEITWDNRVACKRMWGLVSSGEFMQSIAEIQNDRRFDRLRYSINNLLEAEALQFSEADIEYYAATGLGAAMSNPHLRIAIVATDERILSLIRVYSKLADYSVNYFETMAQVHEWIAANEVAEAS